ncbi:MAG: PAS domain S-box protein [Nanoarchaeota archaeon]|nr:PAS domain S-box protein [DPANN group archaeon]MBL7116443.1 PAS domain S-box protein [Nanoarchaeota archaeon]
MANRKHKHIVESLEELAQEFHIPNKRINSIIEGIPEYNQTENELREAEQVLKNINKGVTESILILSKDFEILWGNESALKEIGYELGDIIRSHCYKVTHFRDTPCEDPHHPCPVSVFLETGKPKISIHTHIDKYDDKKFVEVSAFPIKDEKREITKFVYISRDITERVRAEKELRASQERLESILQTASDGIISIDEDQRIVQFNQGAERIFGYKADEIIGESLNKIIPYRYRDIHLEHITKFFKSSETARMIYERRTEIYGLTKNGEEVPLEVSINKIKSNGEEIFTAFVRDISKRKEAEKELRKSNELKALLLDIITHDLKNPAGAIYGFADVMRSEKDPETLYEVAGYIEKSSGELLRVLENVTTLASIELGDEIRKEDLDLAEVVEDVVSHYSVSLAEKGMYLENLIQEPLPVSANPIISEVFDNYLSNAIKYAKEGKRIIIEAEQDDKYFTVYVKDFGVTIPPENHREIFERTAQLEKGNGGRGLGLAIVKRIAERHDAEVGVVPNKPKGCSFYLKIPRR